MLRAGLFSATTRHAVRTYDYYYEVPLLTRLQPTPIWPDKMMAIVECGGGGSEVGDARGWTRKRHLVASLDDHSDKRFIAHINTVTS